MLKTRARIIRIDGEKAFVQADPGFGCEQCKGKGCGSSKLSQLFCSTPRQFQVDNSINAKQGDDVVVAIAEGVVLRGIGLVYVLPLLLMLTGAMVGNVWANDTGMHDGYAVIGALSGLLIGFVSAKQISLQLAKGYFQPYLTGLYRSKL